ncbi:LOW QUALITY PROTEIN: hypothetical protein PHMEG_00019478 [Phytophthora megakarya]|uniref:RNase H type-1 domain-containing protein n=1 Tax=Phytophthora megakarya TaxID=4795 RepID=A0A225VU16_9STRA|nr:LOW QUALITY PROTEIN: hypothetical protein PHMEG_00019478 [Phytophthora megakarya]
MKGLWSHLMLPTDSVEASGVADSDRWKCLPRANYGEYGTAACTIAAPEHGAEELVIVGDSRLATQQSLGVIACQLVAKLKSVRYLHVVREYNAAADSLAGEALESKVSKVVVNGHRKPELKELNRIQEMIYEPSSDDIKVENTSSETFAQILDGRHATFTLWTAISCYNASPLLISRTKNAPKSQLQLETKTKKKRVHFEDGGPEGTTNTAATETTETATGDSAMQAQRPNAEVRYGPTDDDIDPVTVQEEQRRRIAQAQNEELMWSNLMAILRGETTTMTYKETREAWKWADNFVLSSAMFCITRVRKVDENSPEMSLRRVVPSTMIQEVLHNCHDSIEGGH